MQFLGDMGIANSVIRALRDEGHDATHLIDARLFALPDEQVLEKARAERRILLTHDLDMGRLLAHTGSQLPSVITFRLSNMRPESVIAHLRPVLQGFENELRTGCAITVTDKAARCHILPIKRD